MKKRLVRIFLVAIALVLIGTVLFFYVNQEPSYEGRPLSAWVDDLRGGDPQRRATAETALQQMGPSIAPVLADELRRPPGALQRLNHSFGRRVPDRFKSAIRKALGRRGAYNKYAIAEALEVMGTNGLAAMPALAELLRSDNALLSTEASRALAAMGSHAVPTLVEALGHPAYLTRNNACSALARIGPAGSQAAPVLARIIANETGPLTSAAAHALSQIGAEAVPHLTPLLASSNWYTRRWAAHALASIRRPASNAIPALLAVSDDPHPQVRWTVLNAVHAIDWPSPAWAAVTSQALFDRDSNVVTTALLNLSMSPRQVTTNLGRIAELLTNDAPNIQAQASATISQAGPAASNALPVLEKLSVHGEPAVQTRALESLHAISNALSRTDRPLP